MRWLIRQWYRVQLARELLEQYEYEEAHRISWPEALSKLEYVAWLSSQTQHDATARWAAVTRAKAAQYPSDA